MNNSAKIIEQPLGEWYKDMGGKKNCLKFTFKIINEDINEDNINLLSGKEKFDKCRDQNLLEIIKIEKILKYTFCIHFRIKSTSKCYYGDFFRLQISFKKIKLISNNICVKSKLKLRKRKLDDLNKTADKININDKITSIFNYLKKDYDKIKEENDKIKEENDKIKEENDKLKKTNAKLRQEVKKLKEENNSLSTVGLFMDNF
jgi:FtsZ-binding cell division protein ZapB